MAPTVLLTLGRLPKALDLARGLHARGCRVVVAEPFRYHVCRMSRAVSRSFQVTAPNRDPERYLAELTGIIETESVDVVVPISEEALHALRLAGRVDPAVRFYSAPAGLIARLHDKWTFNQLAQAIGLPVPESAPIEAPEAADLAARVDCITKPRDGCSGIGFRRWQRGDALHAAGLPHGTLVQRRVEGEHLSSFSITRAGRVIGTVTYRGRVFSGTVAVCFERVDLPAAVEDWIQRFVSATGYDGFLSLDFIVEAGRPLAIECNPRLTSGAHFVRPDTLAAAVLEEADSPFTLRPERLLQQFYTTLTETQRAMFGRGPFKDRLQHLLAAKDVVWSARDPLPFLMMTPASAELLALTLFKGMSFGEAATADVAWFGAAGSLSRGGAPGT